MKALNIVAAAVTLLTVGAFLVGCDVGINPLLFDGTPVEASYCVEVTSGTTISPISKTVNLEDILSSIEKDIDSVKIYNITLLVDSTTGTAPGVDFTDSLYMGSTKVFSMNGTPLTAFTTERSIFDPSITGLQFGSTIVSTLTSYIDPKNRPAPTVTLTFAGSASNQPLLFTVHLKIYAQVYTKPK